MGNKSDIENALLNEVKNGNLKELIVNGAEITLDHILKEGVVKDIPIIGSIYNVLKTSITIKDAFFLKKLNDFLLELKDIPAQKRRDFIDRLEKSEDYQNKVGEKLLIIIERLDDLEKSSIIGKLFKATVDGKLTYDEFLFLSSIIDKAFLVYLKRLKNHPFTTGITKSIQQHFVSIEIMDFTIESKEQRIMYDSKINLTPVIKYNMNEMGLKLIEYGL